MNKQKELAKIFMIISDARKSVKMKKDISLQFCFDNNSFSFLQRSNRPFVPTGNIFCSIVVFH